MARLTETERELILAARARGPHPSLHVPSPTDISAADLRRYAEAERNRYLAELVTNIATRFTTAFRRKRVEARTRKALDGLSDVILSDIGVRRTEIRDVARRHARKVCPSRPPLRRRPAANGALAR